MASSNAAKMLRRYGPIVAVVAVVAGIVVVAGGGGDDDDGEPVRADDGDRATELPVTFQEAQEQGLDIDFGPNCDTGTGRVRVPIHNAPPCVEPWPEGADNGGATAPGVTADEIVIALYKAQPDPLQQALVEDAGANTDPALVNQTYVDYLNMLADVFETYGRELRIVTIEATGGPADATAARADAQKVIDLEPFAAVNGPTQTPVYWQELADAGILCLGNCSIAEKWDLVEDAAPYLWPTGPAPEQADEFFLELVGKQLVGKPAEFAGDPALQTEERVFGWVQAERETDEFAARVEEFERRLADEYGGEIAARSTYLFDIARGQEIATTVITRMKDAGVTTVLLSTDPLVPRNLTEEATKQNYFPEWVIGPTVLVDTTFLGRTYDQRQWAHAFGISLPTARQDNQLEESWFAYEWYYGKEPATNTQAVIYPGPFRLLLGIHLAGPNLTPETFRQGMFRYPPEPGGLTYTHQSWGEELWGRPDYNSTDDATIVWWDPDATGEDEAGNDGTGMLRYVDGGRRYLKGEWPDEEVPFFEEEGTVTVYTELPESDRLPELPPWPGSPAATAAGG
jgi:hypothetical protein